VTNIALNRLRSAQASDPAGHQPEKLDATSARRTLRL
jgi:hypothetical protein